MGSIASLLTVPKMNLVQQGLADPDTRTHRRQLNTALGEDLAQQFARGFSCFDCT